MQYTLTSGEVHAQTTTLLRTALRLSDYKQTCPVPTLLGVVYVACARLVSISAAAAGLLYGPCAETIRKALLAQFGEIDELQRRFNLAFRYGLPSNRDRRRRKYWLAVDLTLIPYHGKPQKAENELYRGQPKGGTTHFHAYASLCIVETGQRFTVALRYVRHKEKMAAVVKALLRTAAEVRIRPRKLLLDRGFYAVDVVCYLKRAGYPFVMPVPMKGRRPNHPKGPGGTRVFGTWKRSGYSRYRLHSTGKQGEWVEIGVHCRNRAGRRGKHGRERLVYAFWGFTPPKRVKDLSEQYRRRFGIETSYRQMHQARARTSTRNPLVRLFLVGVALVLRNVWVWLTGLGQAANQKSRRRLARSKLTLKQMLHWLQLLVEETFGVITELQTEHPTKPIVM